MAIELRIKEVIKNKKIMQKRLAEELGVSKVTMSYWCNNQSTPSLQTLDQIAKILKVKVADLINE
jgi:putative transcriptional regulator